jgi:nicotinamidase-related amidase
VTGTWPLPDVEFALDVRRTAIVIVDMQYYDADRGSGIGKSLEAARPGYTGYYFERVETTVVPAIRRLIEHFRRRELPVIFLTYASERDDGSDLAPLLRARNEQRRRTLGAPGVYPRSAPEARILAALGPGDGDIVLNKTSQSAFTTTPIADVLHARGIDGILVTGVVTNVCVEATARDAADRGLKTVIVDDACAAWEPAFHEATLRSFRTFVGRVATADALIRELSGSERARAG